MLSEFSSQNHNKSKENGKFVNAKSYNITITKIKTKGFSFTGIFRFMLSSLKKESACESESFFLFVCVGGGWWCFWAMCCFSFATETWFSLLKSISSSFLPFSSCTQWYQVVYFCNSLLCHNIICWLDLLQHNLFD